MKRIFLIGLTFAAASFAQNMVSARAGMIQHIEGDVKLDGSSVAMPSQEKMFSQFPEVKKGSTLSTGEGRAEILLSPGVTLRLGEDAAFKMIDSDLGDTRLELTQGMAIVEVIELIKENLVTITAGQASVEFWRPGVYKFHVSDTPELLVYDGQAEVTIAGRSKSYKRGNGASLQDALVARKFDADQGDSLLRWSMRRSGYMAMANVSAATAARSSYSGSSGTYRGWYWNPYYMMYTYLPNRGMFCNSYMGYCYYSPSRVQQAFYTPPVYRGGGGDAGMSRGGNSSFGYNQNLGYSVSAGSRSYDSGGGGSGGGMSAPAAAGGAPAAAAPSGGGRSGGDAGGRGGQGGGRAQ